MFQWEEQNTADHYAVIYCLSMQKDTFDEV